MTSGDDAGRSRLEILGTVHQTLQAARGSTVFESSGRANLFLTTVSSSLVALAFIGQATELGSAFYLFAYVILACLVFVGLVTFVRVVQTGLEDMRWRRGIGRVLNFYVQKDPELRAYLVQSPGDDTASLLETYGRGSSVQILFSTGSMVGVVTSALFAVLAGVASARTLGWPQLAAQILGFALFLAGVAGQTFYQHRQFVQMDGRVPSRFPAQPPRT
jgi:hypothetical protein